MPNVLLGVTGSVAAIKAPVLFDDLDGFASARTARMTWRAILQAADGRIWINTAAGLAVANPGGYSPAGSPRVMIEEVQAERGHAASSSATRRRR